jgi:hypothetical protein
VVVELVGDQTFECVTDRIDVGEPLEPRMHIWLWYNKAGVDDKQG